MEIRENSHLIKLFEKYSKGEEHLGNGIIELQKKLNNQEIIIPFLGMQGAGKSTLINSLLGKNILPNEADETTCIPVEVRFGQNESALVYQKDGSTIRVEATNTALAEFVDNRYNPGNNKEIKRIIIEQNNELLKSGVIVVDLPGVGSLTHENEETTKDYIKNLSAAVFLFQTTPPIGKKDATFIKGVWRGINTAYFVQNIWTDNSENEKNEALAHNRNILTQIADEINAQYDGRIIPVNAFYAAEGAFNNDEDKVRKSNIGELEEELINFASNYKVNSQESFRGRVFSTVEYVKDEIENRISQYSKSYEEIMEELNDRKRDLEERNDEIRRISGRIDDKIFYDKKEVKAFAKDIAEKKTNLLRVEMHKLIDKGIVDGPNLDKAFSENQEKHIIEVCDETFEKLNALCAELQEDYDDLFLSLDKYNKDFEGEVLNKAQKLKWEKGLKAGLILGADIGALFAGGAIASGVSSAIAAGAGTGAAVGTAAGPIGIAVGAAAGITISLIGLGVASLVKKGITKKRGEETKREMEPILESYHDLLLNTVKEYSDGCFDAISKNVEEYTSAMKEQLKYINDEISQKRREGEQMKYTEEELREDLSFLKKWEAENE